MKIGEEIVINGITYVAEKGICGCENCDIIDLHCGILKETHGFNCTSEDNVILKKKPKRTTPITDLMNSVYNLNQSKIY